MSKLPEGALLYRPNPERGIYVQGTIDQSLIDRLTPGIISLQSQSRDPITVYIDSRGGSTVSSEALWRLLTASDQDFSLPCRIITVVTSRAASAAADLLSSGDYALAYADSTLMYHGVRYPLDNPITVEAASFLAESLKSSNDRYAMILANRTIERFIFRCISMNQEFDTYRRNAPGASDLQCFGALARARLSPQAIQVLEQAQQRNSRYEQLVVSRAE
jgi:ATP-dependent protease ClpP protease subunit